MEPKHFILLFFIVICQFVFFKLVYSKDNANEITYETTDGGTLTSVSEGNFIVQDNTTETINFTESLVDDNTTTVIPTTVEISTKPPKALPKLPEAFQARIRLSIVSHPSSAYNAILSYDLKKNIAAITKTVSQGKSRRIYDFKNSKILNIKDGRCVVDDISENSTEDVLFPFPFYISNEQKQMKGPLSIFRLDGNDTEIAEEEIFVGGVPCMQFNNTINMGYVDRCRKTIQCKIRHFYSNPEWKNPNCLNTFCGPLPVRIEVECEDNPMLCNYLRLIVSFNDFYGGIKNEEEFQPLPGIYCNDTKTESEQFPMIPMSFHATLVERNFLDNTLKTEKIWLNERGNVFRHDTIVGNEKIMSVIMDYNRNLSYSISKLVTACNAVYVHDVDQPSEVSLLLGSNLTIEGIQKVGKRKCELLECEVWTVKTNEGKTFDVYLKKQISAREEYIPVFVDSFQSDKVPTHYARKIFNGYRSTLGEWSVFDVTPCFVNKCSINFKLTIKGEIGERWKISSFRENIYHTIWNHSKMVSPLRLQKLQIVPETNETIAVRGTIIDDRYIIHNQCLKDISSENALKNIQEMSNQEGLFHNEEIKVTGVAVDAPSTDGGGKKYGPGDMAGLAVGMLLGGTTIGAAIVLIIIRIRKKK